jgi:RNA polymerase sigma-70 factor (ECF subfamily)
MPAPDSAFLRMVEPHQGALRLHCYRMLGSSQDSDDMMQETLVRAWRAKDTLDEPSRLRSWLYRIATNACLDELRNRKARPLPSAVVPEAENPSAAAAPPSPEVTWIQPCPDAWLAGVAQDPGAAYEVKESVALAFVAALQCLSAQQRAVLLLRDVLGMPADETASTLGMSVSAASSTLHRARTAVRERAGDAQASEVDAELLGKYLRAWESLDLQALVKLLHEDVVTTMPPSPTWLRGRVATRRFFDEHAMRGLRPNPPRLLRTGANGQPAFAFYVRGHLSAIHVLGFREGRVVTCDHFMGEDCFGAFGLPASLSN